MTSSSTEPAVVPCGIVATVAPARGVEVRSGSWARLGEGPAFADPTHVRLMTEMADRARASGRAQGYAQGWAEGRRAADERSRLAAQEVAATRAAEDRRRRVEHDHAVGALLAAAGQLRHEHQRVCAQVEQQATELAFSLVEGILGRELELAADPGADAVRRALALLPEETVATVRLHPDDLAGAAGSLCPEGARLVGDPSLRRGDAILDTVGAVIDARVSTAVARVREVWQ